VDFERDGEQDEEIEEFMLKSEKDMDMQKFKSSKYMPTKLEMIPEASVRFEETLGKGSKSTKITPSSDRSHKKRKVKRVKVK